LKLVVYSLFNIGEKRQNFIEQIKMETQFGKDQITLVPENSDFVQIDHLIGEIKRCTYMEEKYAAESDPNTTADYPQFCHHPRRKRKGTARQNWQGLQQRFSDLFV
jgi:hypothetical protein